jgi:DNA-binding winged helix-turn-helix (wHTH) protein/tetratricopeptide (TPR) repeat protein
MTAARIDLGLALPVHLGRLTLQPAVRVIKRDDGTSEIVEPRVMQVLLALVEARGEIVRREDLTERCWDGRVVGEDAINRVLSRLRRVAEGIGEGSFRIETITRIGYRLIELGDRAERPPVAALSAKPATPPGLHPTRRTAMIGVSAAAGGLALAGGAWWWSRRREMPAPAQAAMERGMAAFRQLSLADLTTAAAAFHEATQLAPDFAEPWGSLALTYRWLYFTSHGQEASLNAQRARDAAAKALHIDPDNGDAQATLATLRPEFRNWLAYDAACAPILARHPDQMGINMLYIDLLSNVGRIRSINEIAQRLVAKDPAWPTNHMSVVLSNWCLGRLDDADTAMDRAFQQWPRNGGVWFIRQRLLAYSGRAAAAVAMIEDVDHRPPGLPSWDFDLSLAESRALLSRSKADIDAAAGFYRERARHSVGVAGNAAQFFTAVGRLDDAFAMLNALYFNRGFDVGIRSFSEEQGTYSERRNRATWLFWLPFMADLRADPRMAAIAQEVGLTDYWRKSGNRPDFSIAGLAG